MSPDDTRPAPDPLLFVYGTLRAGAGHPMHAVLASGARLLGPATMTGRLYDAGPWPAAVTGPEGVVVGELYALHHGEAGRVLARLDAYESGAAVGAPGFVRVEGEVRSGPRAAVRAFMYVWRGPVDGWPDIPGGDWLTRHLTRTEPIEE